MLSGINWNDILSGVGIGIASGFIFFGFLVAVAWLVQIHDWLKPRGKDGKK